jgi:hypothetical protein
MVVGPTKALIHLQNSGQLFGLPAALADQLEREAQNGNIPALRAVSADLNDAMLASAVDLLTQLARTAVGYESFNIVQAILVLLTPGVPEGRAAQVAAAVGPIVDRQPTVLAESTVIGAWHLALASKRAEARTLGRHVLASEYSGGESMVAAIVENAEQAKTFGAARLSQILVGRLLGENPDLAIQALLSSDDTNRLATLKAIDADFRKQIIALLEAHSVWKTAEDARKAEAAVPATAVSRAAAAAAAATTDDDQEVEPYDGSALLGQLLDLAAALKSSDPASAELILSILLDVRRDETRSVISQDTSRLNGLVKTQRGVAGVLRELSAKHYTFWPKYLRVIDSGSVAAVSTAPDSLVKMVSELGAKTVEWTNDAADRYARDTAAAIVEIMEKLDDDTTRRIGSAAETLGGAVTSDAGVTEHLRRVEVAMILADEGLCSPQDVLESEARALVATFEIQQEPEEATSSPLAEYAVHGIERVLTGTTSGEPNDVSVDAQSDLLAALDSCVWLSGTDTICARAVAVALAAPGANRHGLMMPTASEIKGTQSELGDDRYSWLVQFWLRRTDAELADILSVIQPLLAVRPSNAVLNAVREWRKHAGIVERRELVDHLIGQRGRVQATQKVFDAIGLNELPDTDAAAMLVKLYKAAKTNPHRIEVLLLWEAAKI